MKKKTLIIGAVVAIVILAFMVSKPFGKHTAVYTFDTVKVERGKLSNVVTATGTIEAVTSVDVGTQVSGIIDKIFVDFNDNVKRGQVLAQIDRTTLLAQLEQSKATVDQAQANLVYQEANYDRIKALFEKQLVAKSDYDQAFYNYENAKASLRNAKSANDKNITNLNYSTITSPIDGVVLNRAVEEGQTVAASFNTPTLFTIVNDLTRMKVEASVDEADIGKVKEGQRVEFTVDSYSDMKFEGSVTEVRLQPTTTNNVVTYTVILDAPNPDKKLMPGMTASANIFVDEKDNALMLSGKAVRFTPDADYLQKQMKKMMKQMPKGGQYPKKMATTGNMGAANGQSSAMSTSGSMPTITGSGLPSNAKMVWVKDGKGGIRPQPITVGIDNGTYYEVLTGLKEGDEVVIAMSDGSVKATRQSTSQRRGPFPF
jgi:HlyD family secretion protein